MRRLIPIGAFLLFFLSPLHAQNEEVLLRIKAKEGKFGEDLLDTFFLDYSGYPQHFPFPQSFVAQEKALEKARNDLARFEDSKRELEEELMALLLLFESDPQLLKERWKASLLTDFQKVFLQPGSWSRSRNDEAKAFLERNDVRFILLNFAHMELVEKILAKTPELLKAHRTYLYKSLEEIEAIFEWFNEKNEQWALLKEELGNKLLRPYVQEKPEEFDARQVHKINALFERHAVLTARVTDALFLSLHGPSDLQHHSLESLRKETRQLVLDLKKETLLCPKCYDYGREVYRFFYNDVLSFWEVDFNDQAIEALENEDRSGLLRALKKLESFPANRWASAGAKDTSIFSVDYGDNELLYETDKTRLELRKMLREQRNGS